MTPSAPNDLWERLDALRERERASLADTFTIAEFRDRYQLKRGCAHERIQKMLRDGVIELVPTLGPSGIKYYRVKEGE